ncbi:hypothetical protein F4808DRAFT_242580 [Astrocystis sublimbata]|nr:hypothetical protein F4808DRAFT_242580 [Astrocystis sublimbata]
MPLHLLGKKSWNVYNPANIARVKRDEEADRARAEVEEKRREDLEAERRLAILRGEVPPTLEAPPSPPHTTVSNTYSSSTSRKREHDGDSSGQQFGGGERRKRKRFGEDDTDFEMRVARERTDAVVARSHSANTTTKTSDAPLVDSRGHISLFPEEREERGPSKNEKNEEAEREAAKKRQDFEDQYTMRFANAAGRDGAGVDGPGPWYGARERRDGADKPGKDAFGRDDPRRKDRDAARVAANDPLAMMKRGAAKVRDVERERRAVNEERAQELKLLGKEEKRREKRRRRHDDVDELEGFSLDAQPAESKRRHGHREHGHREHRSDSRGRDRRDEHRHRHRSHHDDDRKHRHHRSEDHSHEGKRHRDHRGSDSEGRERHSSRPSRRESARTG